MACKKQLGKFYRPPGISCLIHIDKRATSIKGRAYRHNCSFRYDDMAQGKGGLFDMEFHNVPVVQDIVFLDPLPVEFRGTPDAGVLQVFDEVPVDRLGEIDNRGA